MVIILQISSVEPSSHEVTFHGHFQISNAGQYQRINPPRQGELGHYRYLSKPVYLLSRDQRPAYIATTVQRILEFLEM
jgi:hypothetical protein